MSRAVVYVRADPTVVDKLPKQLPNEPFQLDRIDCKRIDAASPDNSTF
jgi:hypothetical protein